ncbi:MAG: bifunctional DNA-formamidopyrimidine glycosylase/DNA-(apurinic or apyrimidinic site) lyase [Gammaproteobacteria bacterium]|nr:bifunctional DNA-formamidopyrimidine glycosylase/DNA-(apurinic or apyrimidinic site) lyase [Gammaproteobacteria bacterium]
MPELPEVETTLRGIKPHIIGQRITRVIVRNARLRWPIPASLQTQLLKQAVQSVERRGKYLLLQLERGTCLIHLGMSGRLSVLNQRCVPQKHDHVDIYFANHLCLRFTDPRRFGALLYTEKPVHEHRLLSHLGVEPLSASFNADYLWQSSRGKKVSIKTFIMNSKIVVGVGNIYAAESLFQARILPQISVSTISLERYAILVTAIKKILKKAITKGGTTLKDFMRSDGSPGYFRISLQVYGRAGKPCLRCDAPLKFLRSAQRATVYCDHCQF